MYILCTLRLTYDHVQFPQVIPVCLLVFAEARRVQQLRPRVDERQVYYVDEDQDAEEEDAPVVYQPRTRALPSPRSKDTSASKAPPVQTIRNYNKVNDDGSFTFGYEAADGSFKEETRGTDCVVRGKYGYVDPDGNKREFTYVSGNPCDPNAKPEDDDEPVRGQPEEEASGPANYPSVRPVPRPIRPTYAPTTRAPTTVFQSQYQIDDDDESQELEDVRPQRLPQRRPQAQTQTQTQTVTIPRRQQYSQSPAPPTATLYQNTAPRYQTPTTPAPIYRTSPAPSSTIYRATEAPTTPAPRPQTYRPPLVHSVAITPRPLAAQVAAQYTPASLQTERPGVIYAPVTSRTTASTGSNLNFAAELERYVNTVGINQARPGVRPTRPTTPAKIRSQNSEAIYQSELVYDPATGQYNTQLYQTLPQTVGDFSLSHKLQPFVAQQQQQQQQLQRQQLAREEEPRQAQTVSQSLYRQAVGRPAPTSAVPQPQEAIYRQQQAQLFQQSQQLFAQQQRRQQQPQPQAHRFQALESQQGSQPFYYISPTARSTNSETSGLSVGQIDQFLRGATGAF